jgi:hypothetical protein
MLPRLRLRTPRASPWSSVPEASTLEPLSAPKIGLRDLGLLVFVCPILGAIVGLCLSAPFRYFSESRFVPNANNGFKFGAIGLLAFADRFLLGFVMSALAIRYRSLLPGFVMHATLNGAACILSVLIRR